MNFSSVRFGFRTTKKDKKKKSEWNNYPNFSVFVPNNSFYPYYKFHARNWTFFSLFVPVTRTLAHRSHFFADLRTFLFFFLFSLLFSVISLDYYFTDRINITYALIKYNRFSIVYDLILCWERSRCFHVSPKKERENKIFIRWSIVARGHSPDFAYYYFSLFLILIR